MSLARLVGQKASWLFDATQIREKLFTVSGVEVKHKLDQVQQLNNLEKARQKIAAENKKRLQEEAKT